MSWDGDSGISSIASSSAPAPAEAAAGGGRRAGRGRGAKYRHIYEESDPESMITRSLRAVHGLSHRLDRPLTCQARGKPPGAPGQGPLLHPAQARPGCRRPAVEVEKAAKKEAKEVTTREKEMFACFEEVVIGLQETEKDENIKHQDTEKDILQRPEPRGFYLSTQDTVQWPAMAGDAVGSNKKAALSIEKDENTNHQETEKDGNFQQVSLGERKDPVKTKDMNQNRVIKESETENEGNQRATLAEKPESYRVGEFAASRGAKILTCQSCPASFVQLGQLEDHVAEVHGLEAVDYVQHEYFDSSSDTD